MIAVRDPDLVARAKERTQTSPRSLRMIGVVEYRDMVIYEDRATGERRSLPQKHVLNLGPAVVFELADTESLLGEQNA